MRVNAMLPGVVAVDRQRRLPEAKARRLGKRSAEVETAFGHASMAEYAAPRQIADQRLLTAGPHGRRIAGQALQVCRDPRMSA